MTIRSLALLLFYGRVLTSRLRIDRFVLGMCLAIAAGCSDVTGPAHDLANARRQWAWSGITSYDLVITEACFCGNRGPIRTQVRNGVVVSQTYTLSGQALPSLSDRATVAGLFDYLESVVRQNPDHLEVEYNDFGVPIRIQLDMRSGIADDEYFLTAALER